MSTTPNAPAVYGRKHEINIGTVSTPAWAEIAQGIDTLKASYKENVETNQFLSGKGMGETDVYGAIESYNFAGKRRMADAAQNFIFANGMKRAFGLTRHTQYRMTDFDGSTLTWDATIANIDDQGGKAVEGSAISFDLFCNGQPTFSPAIGTLTVVSVAGSTSGQTQIYVNPAKSTGNSYFYKTGASVSLPQGSDTIGTGYTAWDGTSAITATTGNQIVVVEATVAGAPVNAGIAIITSKA